MWIVEYVGVMFILLNAKNKVRKTSPVADQQFGGYINYSLITCNDTLTPTLTPILLMFCVWIIPSKHPYVTTVVVNLQYINIYLQNTLNRPLYEDKDRIHSIQPLRELTSILLWSVATHTESEAWCAGSQSRALWWTFGSDCQSGTYGINTVVRLHGT